jgi:isoquinoline 1-oxidoreductase beta subunit
MFGMQMTGGSSSVVNSFDQLRTVGAQARTMLVQAAAQQWNAKPEDLRVEKGFVIGPGGKRASYGQLAEAAGKLPVPEKVTLKDPKNFQVIGKPTRRLDSAEKVKVARSSASTTSAARIACTWPSWRMRRPSAAR